MKKTLICLLEFIKRQNLWFDNLSEFNRFLAFLIGIVCTELIATVIFGNIGFVIWCTVALLWRIIGAVMIRMND